MSSGSSSIECNRRGYLKPQVYIPKNINIPDIFARNAVGAAQDLKKKLYEEYANANLANHQIDSNADLLLHPKTKKPIFKRMSPTTPIPNSFKRYEDQDDGSRLKIIETCFKKNKSGVKRGLHVFMHSINNEHIYTDMKMPDSNKNERVCQLRFVGYGVDEFGRNMRLETYGHEPNMYVSYPYQWNLDDLRKKSGNTEKERRRIRDEREKEVKKDLEMIRNAIEKKVKSISDEKKLNKYGLLAKSKGYRDGRIILSLEITWNIDAVGYKGDKPEPFIKINVVSPEIIPLVRRAFENPFKKVVLSTHRSYDNYNFSYLEKVDGWMQENTELLNRLFSEDIFKSDLHRLNM